MNISSLQKRVAKSFAFDVDALRLIQAVASVVKSSGNADELKALVLCTKEQASTILSMPYSVVIIHALERHYSKLDVVSSIYADDAKESRQKFFKEYVDLISIYKETVELIGLNASIEQVLELNTSSVFKRRDWPKIRFIFSKEIENIYHKHQERKKSELNKSDDEIQLEWNEHIKHSKGRKLSIADKVRIQNVMSQHDFTSADLSKGSVLISIAKEALVDIVQINQIFN